MVQVKDLNALHSWHSQQDVWEHESLPQQLSFNKIPQKIPWQHPPPLTNLPPPLNSSFTSFFSLPPTALTLGATPFPNGSLSPHPSQGMNSKPEKGLDSERSGIGHCHIVKPVERFPETWITCGGGSQGGAFPVAPALASTLQHLYVPGRHKQGGRPGESG